MGSKKTNSIKHAIVNAYNACLRLPGNGGGQHSTAPDTEDAANTEEPNNKVEITPEQGIETPNECETTTGALDAAGDVDTMDKMEKDVKNVQRKSHTKINNPEGTRLDVVEEMSENPDEAENPLETDHAPDGNKVYRMKITRSFDDLDSAPEDCRFDLDSSMVDSTAAETTDDDLESYESDFMEEMLAIHSQMVRRTQGISGNVVFTSGCKLNQTNMNSRPLFCCSRWLSFYINVFTKPCTLYSGHVSHWLHCFDSSNTATVSERTANWQFHRLFQVQECLARLTGWVYSKIHVVPVWPQRSLLLC